MFNSLTSYKKRACVCHQINNYYSNTELILPPTTVNMFVHEEKQLSVQLQFGCSEGIGARIRVIKCSRGSSASIIVIYCKGRQARHSIEHVTLGLCHRLSCQNYPFLQVTAQQWLLCKLCHAAIIKGTLLRRLKLTPHSLFLPMPCLIVHELNARLLKCSFSSVNKFLFSVIL